jgi:hypothetical protein
VLTKKQWKREYSKITAGSAQNDDFYCNNQYFSLLLLTNPLSYTIRHKISMGVVAICGLLSLPLQHHNRESPWSFLM